MTPVSWALLGLSLAACSGRYVTDGATAQGGSGGSISDLDPTSACLNSGQSQSGATLTFLFESPQALFINNRCDVEYTLTKLCDGETAPVVTEAMCSQACDLQENGGQVRGACAGPQRAGEYHPDGSNVTSWWDGYLYTARTSSSGCTCIKGMAATTGTYAIAVTAYPDSGSAMERAGGFPFTTRFNYPALDGIVRVPLEVAAP